VFLNISSNLSEKIEHMKTMSESDLVCVISRLNKHMAYENEDTILNCILAWFNFSDFSSDVDEVMRDNVNWN